MTLESAKYMGGIGSLLLVIGSIGIYSTPFVGLLGLVGLILILIALHSMADFYSDRGIFSNALYALIIGIVGVVAFIGTLFAALIAFVSNLPSWAEPYINAQDWQGLTTAIQNHITDVSSALDIFGSLIFAVILALIVLFVFLVVTFFFFRRSLGRLSTKTHVGLFGTAGLLMLIGAVLTIIIVGFLLIWIGWILLTIAFFSIHETAAPAQTATVTPPATT
jgi:uncharacterized membrane protein